MSKGKNLVRRFFPILITGLFVAGIIVFLTLFRDTIFLRVMDADIMLSEFVLRFRSNGMNIFFTLITTLGDIEFLVFATLVTFFFLLFNNHRHTAWVFFFGMISSALSMYIMKIFVGRMRPDASGALVNEDLFSFPSGHAVMSMFFYGFLAVMASRIFMSSFRKKSAIVFCAALIFLIGLSRVYLGVHYASDVLAGFFLGGIWLFAMSAGGLDSFRNIREN